MQNIQIVLVNVIMYVFLNIYKRQGLLYIFQSYNGNEFSYSAVKPFIMIHSIVSLVCFVWK